MSRENLAIRDALAYDQLLFVKETSTSVGVGLGCALDSFTQANEVKSWIQELPEFIENDHRLEQQTEQFITILNLYQEQPHLLDPHIPEMLGELIKLIRLDDLKLRHAASAFATHICKVRKAKVVIKQLPHEVSDVESVIKMLETENPEAYQHWETRYFLLLWLSMLVLIPFDLSRFDSGAIDDAGNVKIPLMERLLNLIKTYLKVSNKCQDASALLASKFLTRPEITIIYLPSFISWSTEIIENKQSQYSDINRIGVLKAIASILKQAKRDDILEFAPDILKTILEQNFKNSSNGQLRKLSLKVVQRLGLAFLKTKVATWRYQRGSRSLALNLKSSTSVELDKNNTQDATDEDEEDYDIPDELEEVIEELLCGLKDRETVSRWSAAKGIGRVTNRLPKELADDVVGSLLSLFTLRETEGAWHGGCLALAELGRRGLLLPERLSEVVHVVLKALVFDEKKGNFSVGSQIRDAACYVCWSFARAYDPKVLEPYVPKIANALLTVTIFDREVNCRRAASAAFQENVGRQGTFPHGIDIITKADYFSVGSRNNAYLNLSVYIAQFAEYGKSLINHLLDKKVGHWDIGIREITAMAIHNLTEICLREVLDKILPSLILAVRKEDIFTQHGSIVAIGWVIHALSKVAKKSNKTLSDLIDSKTIDSIKTLASIVIQQITIRSSGKDLLRQGITTFIDQCSQGKFPIHGEETVNLWLVILGENLSNPDPLIQEKAILAIPSFMNEYFRDPLTKKLLVEERDNLIQEYLRDIDNTELHRRGIALAIGALPKFLLENRLPDIIKKLIDCTKITKDTEKWAEGRRDCIIALKSLVKTVGLANEQGPTVIGQSTMVMILECFIKALDDYTIDRRGDIGAWVREAAMTGLVEVTEIAFSEDPNLVSEICIREIMPGLAQQSCEKIDRTRGLAVQLFTSLVMRKGDDKIPGIPNHDDILKSYPEDFNEKIFQWSVESETFPIFVKLLRLQAYREKIIIGLIVSVGGITERLVKHASSALFSEMKTMNKDELYELTEGVISVFRSNHKNDRIIIPLFKFLDQLLTSGFMDPIMENEEDSLALSILTLLKGEISKCGDPNKLMLSCDVMCALLQSYNNQAVKKSLIQLSIFLCHKFPRIRKFTANKLYEALLIYSDRDIVSEENLDEVNTILSDTNWDQSVEKLRPIRNSLCELFDIPVPTIIVKK